MARDPGQRLQMALDKLSNSNSNINSSGRKRGRETTNTCSRIHNATTTAPPCRPWDRTDLIRRLATFKAITWFAKPKVISPVNCARRGWVNIEMDVIVCEACGARLLFSTPSSWTIEQVEKAAAVFSLKLDNGHKMLCPWIDNACDEALARFPPKPPHELVESYKERSSKLLKLSSLPVISPSTIEYLKTKSPQFELFLSQTPHPSVTIYNGIKLIDDSVNKNVDVCGEASDLYHQAIKVISLCGWELRLLPYVVDYDEQLRLRVSVTTTASSSQILHGQKDSIVIYPAGAAVEATEHVDQNQFDNEYDPASAVLDCRFCGACVALWAFANVQRPLEIHNVVLNTETQKAANFTGKGTENSCLEIQSPNLVTDSSAVKEQSLGLNLTIAGGPPPTKQNFRPRVSFPIVSRHLRIDFNLNRQTAPPENSVKNLMNGQHYIQDENMSSKKNDVDVGSVSKGPLQQKIIEGNDMACTVDTGLQSIMENILDGTTMSPMLGGCSEKGNSLGDTDGDPGNEDITSGRVEISGQGDIRNQEDNKVHEETETPVKSSTEHTGTALAIVVSEDSNFQKNKSIAEGDTTDQFSNKSPKSVTSQGEPSSSDDFFRSASTSDNPAAIATQHLNIESAAVSLSIGTATAEHAHGKTANQDSAITSKFDAIRHHRPYCPWISPEDGESLPGWKLTLSAILQSSAPSGEDATSNMLDEIDDPIVSVRRLFMSPSSKRLKTAK